MSLIWAMVASLDPINFYMAAIWSSMDLIQP